MPRRIVWSPLAEKDLIDISDYLIANWNVKTVNQFLSLVDHLILLVSKNPLQFPKINEELNVRKCVITKHNSIFYRVSSKQIDILRIFDTRQDPIKLKFK